LVGLVLDVRGGNGDAALALFRGVVDLVVGLRLTTELLRLVHRDRRRQRGLAVVDVTDGADVDVRLLAFEFCFGHDR
jgi:hypothetical protein